MLNQLNTKNAWLVQLLVFSQILVLAFSGSWVYLMLTMVLSQAYIYWIFYRNKEKLTVILTPKKQRIYSGLNIILTGIAPVILYGNGRKEIAFFLILLSSFYVSIGKMSIEALEDAPYPSPYRRGIEIKIENKQNRKELILYIIGGIIFLSIGIFFLKRTSSDILSGIVLYVLIGLSYFLKIKK